ncbi:uncharacterized protein K460DRAFT_365443 [Cucurbitaria berberidis CBS 394.84]|uniref:Hydantoinase B/oxoprolinase domain-containing protein n=1 Tax=Cucurbitaria berberidis CBS 394.84 TaxID=1168544 RepID=A0A9P4LCW3_9PLEO|nr:uncharacterized protein K460DRAFT_365443 [Cucurbitaria berberidis CBS 394.84]KAF1849559.1 hypothetical protein K460DRAFT_365443 [Cucurbitaria berberidis CBS 394.84]
MHAVTANAEACVRDFMKRIYNRTSSKPLVALDFMNDGTPFKLTTTINHSFNAPRAIARSTTLYALRCIINQDRPLDEGCLRPLTSTIPEGSILNPLPCS